MENRNVIELQNKINKLNDEISLIQQDKEVIEKKDKKVRTAIITNIFISGAGYYFGGLIHPFVMIGALTFLLLTIIPGAIVTFKHESMAEKYQKQIDERQKEIELTQEAINNLQIEGLENLSIPVENKSVDKTPVKTTNARVKSASKTQKR